MSRSCSTRHEFATTGNSSYQNGRHSDGNAAWGCTTLGCGSNLLTESKPMRALGAPSPPFALRSSFDTQPQRMHRLGSKYVDDLVFHARNTLLHGRTVNHRQTCKTDARAEIVARFPKNGDILISRPCCVCCVGLLVFALEPGVLAPWRFCKA